MGSLQILRTRGIAIAAFVASCAVLSGATSSATTVTYTASGTFTFISGADDFKLANYPFTFTVVATEGMPPTTGGPTWGEFKSLALKATVTSGVEPATPIKISNNNGNIVLATGNPTLDFFTLGSGIKVAGLSIGILAKIAMAKGTLPSDQIAPFTHGVTLSPTNATLTYSAVVGGVPQDTVLGLTGTAFTQVSTTTSTAASTLMLHSTGAEALTSHADGTTSVRPILGAPVSLGGVADRVALRFYASGVRDASDVHVEIGGEDVPVLYAGASGHFDGLDEITVRLPRSLAGRGEVDVALTADGQKANPVRLTIE